MNVPTRTDAIIMGASALVTVVSVAVIRKTHKIQQAKRDEINKEGTLDIAAIRRASEIVRTRMLDSDYFSKGLAYMLMDLDQEMTIQKIAIREEG